jgi:integrase
MPRKIRRGAGEGSVYRFKREGKSGLWAGSIVVGHNASGKLKRKVVYSKSQSGVLKKLEELKAQAKRGVVTDDRKTVGAFLAQWLANIQASIRVTTYESYASAVNRHIGPVMGGIKLSKLQPQHVSDYLAQKLGENKLSARTIAYHRSVLVMALNKAMKWDLVGRNAAALCDKPRVPKREVEPIRPDEAQEFLLACRGSRLEHFFVMLLALGLRRGEALGAKWSDIDLVNRTLNVRRQLQRIRGKLVLTELKTTSSRRTLALSDWLLVRLRAQKQLQLEQKLALGADWANNDLIFCTSTGTPIDPRNVKRSLDAIVSLRKCVHCGGYSKVNPKAPKCTRCDAPLPDKNSFNHYRVHDLRHFSASLLLSRGVNLKLVSDMLGHSTIAVTANTYGHIHAAAKREAAEMMTGLLVAGEE